jgi:hypothetical protein
MFGNHVKKNLSAYAHGELADEESQRIAAHLRACASCRVEFEEIRLGIRLAESLPRAAAPASLWETIEAGLIKTSAAEKEPKKSSLFNASPFGSPFASSFGGRRFAAACAVICVALLSAGTWFYFRSANEAWAVARIEGAPRIDADSIGERGRLGVGEWLETDARSRAEIKVANIGRVEVEPNTRVRLIETRLTEHRLELQRGTLHARIWAPPRLFFVNTPSAVAADLGCAYTLEVDDRGRGLLHVTSGFVALETKGRESMVPAGAACVTEPGTGPGTPFFEDAPEELIDALAKLDFGAGGTAALDDVLAVARPRDTLTLWHLLPRVDADERRRVFERLAAQNAPPEGVTREGVLALDRKMLDAWKDQLESTWTNESLPDVRKVWRKLWK